MQPLGSAGRFAITDFKAATIAAYLQDALPFDLPSGALDLEGEYRVALADKFGLTVDLPTLKLRDIALAPKDVAGAMPWISLPAVEISRASLSLTDRKLAVERIQVDNAKLTVWREPDGQLNLLQLFGARRTGRQRLQRGCPAASATAGGCGSSWSLSVGTLDIRAASIDAEDRMTQPAAKLSFSPVALTVSGYSSEPGNTLKVDASLTVDGKGRVAAQGDLTLAPMTANFAIDVGDFELPPLQPYVAAVTAMQLTGGQFSTKGKLSFAAEPAKGKAGLQFTGDVTVANFATRDTATRQDFHQMAGTAGHRHRLPAGARRPQHRACRGAQALRPGVCNRRPNAERRDDHQSPACCGGRRPENYRLVEDGRERGEGPGQDTADAHAHRFGANHGWQHKLRGFFRPA